VELRQFPADRDGTVAENLERLAQRLANTVRRLEADHDARFGPERAQPCTSFPGPGGDETQERERVGGKPRGDQRRQHGARARNHFNADVGLQRRVNEGRAGVGHERRARVGHERQGFAGGEARYEARRAGLLVVLVKAEEGRRDVEVGQQAGVRRCPRPPERHLTQGPAGPWA
jgi:hypothetical protein